VRIIIYIWPNIDILQIETVSDYYDFLVIICTLTSGPLLLVQIVHVIIEFLQYVLELCQTHYKSSYDDDELMIMVIPRLPGRPDMPSVPGRPSAPGGPITRMPFSPLSPGSPIRPASPA